VGKRPNLFHKNLDDSLAFYFAPCTHNDDHELE